MIWKVKKLFLPILSTVLPLLTIVGIIRFYESGTDDLILHEQERSGRIQAFRKRLIEPLGPFLLLNQRPAQIDLPLDKESHQKVNLEYTIEGNLQTESEKLLKSYRPDYGAVVIMDATSGRILAMASFQKGDESAPNLALRGTYPAASIFKIVTAATALDKYELSPDTLIMFNGGNHTLYRRNVMSTPVTKWTRNMTLREAFARSINTVFARLSFERLQPGDLREYAIRFGFNRDIRSDLPFDPGFTEIPDEKNFHLAELASGYNRVTRMSPIQGAMIAASIANDGLMPIPYIVEKVRDEKGDIIFQSEPVAAAVTMTKAGANRLKELMSETVSSGTGRKSFRKLMRDRKFEELEMGGKTGSLYGDNPKGKVDWFVGYAISENQKLAVAAITVNRDKWTVKSTYLAQSLFRKHFGAQFSKNNEKFLNASSEN